MQEIGRIKQVQVQRSSLKVKLGPTSYYDPAPLLVVRSLQLSAQGVLGITESGERIIDVHHAHHPASCYAGDNGISIGFTSHYQQMRQQLGKHLVDGCAGENILVQSDATFTSADLERGVIIRSSSTGQIVHLVELEIATPCVQFSIFAAQEGFSLPNQRLKEVLQFLDNGRRGFYATLADIQEQAIVQAGDRVFLPGAQL